MKSELLIFKNSNIKNSLKIENLKLKIGTWDDNVEKGQSLVELMVVVTVGVLILSALTFATISSLRNAQLAKNQAEATKYAQEGLEKSRIIRDRNGPLNGGLFSAGWTNGEFSCSAKCYFRLTTQSGADKLVTGRVSQFETSADGTGLVTGFNRQIVVEDGADANEKKFTSRVVWTDFAGSHESTLVTVLRRY